MMRRTLDFVSKRRENVFGKWRCEKRTNEDVGADFCELLQKQRKKAFFQKAVVCSGVIVGIETSRRERRTSGFTVRSEGEYRRCVAVKDASRDGMCAALRLGDSVRLSGDYMKSSKEEFISVKKVFPSQERGKYREKQKTKTAAEIKQQLARTSPGSKRYKETLFDILCFVVSVQGREKIKTKKNAVVEKQEIFLSDPRKGLFVLTLWEEQIEWLRGLGESSSPFLFQNISFTTDGETLQASFSPKTLVEFCRPEESPVSVFQKKAQNISELCFFLSETAERPLSVECEFSGIVSKIDCEDISVYRHCLACSRKSVVADAQEKCPLCQSDFSEGFYFLPFSIGVMDETGEVRKCFVEDGISQFLCMAPEAFCGLKETHAVQKKQILRNISGKLSVWRGASRTVAKISGFA
ncbi:MAG: uncharacterized protein A8A55_1661 [Amphiamblys sp. WSBS2006]|nr:MAG: uncharacterized protein A8A55_1661 [Amphiamblys sp. WSBS2006]